MTSLILVNSQVTEQAANRIAHRELEDTKQVVTCTSLADAATKLTTALTPLVGGTAASTHATAFTARQNVNVSKHTMNFGTGAGMTAVFVP